MGYLFVALTVLLTVAGQLLIKAQVDRAGPVPVALADQAAFVMALLAKPLVLLGLAMAFAAALSWMLALTRLQLSTAYPFTAAGFLLVLAFSALILGEPLTAGKVLGTVLIVSGIVAMAVIE